MSVLKPKSKMISIRLSDAEYENIRNLCVARGARSVSDLAREAMNQLAAGSVAAAPSLEARVQELQVRLDQMAALIGGGK